MLNTREISAKGNKRVYCMTRRRVKGEFPILVKLFGSTEAGELWLQEQLGKNSKLYSVYKTKRKLAGSVKDLLLVEIARRSGWSLADKDFEWC